MAIMAMRCRPVRTVSVADLKNGLSEYLRLVREGEEIVVKNRNVPIAKIVPLSGVDDLDAETVALIAAGKLRPGKGKLPESFWAMPAPKIPLRVIREVMRAEREDD